jgi:hypothetical protein
MVLLIIMAYGEHDAYTVIMSFICFKMNHIVKLIKIRRLRWLGHLLRMQELDPCRKLALLTPEVTKCVGKPKLNVLSQLRKI